MRAEWMQVSPDKDRSFRGQAAPALPQKFADGATRLERRLSVLRWLLDVIDNVNFHDALLRLHSQTQLREHLNHRGPLGDVGGSGPHTRVHRKPALRFEAI